MVNKLDQIKMRLHKYTIDGILNIKSILMCLLTSLLTCEFLYLYGKGSDVLDVLVCEFLWSYCKGSIVYVTVGCAVGLFILTGCDMEVLPGRFSLQQEEREKVTHWLSSVIIRGATVPDFRVRDSANAKPSRFQHFPNRINLQTGSDFP